MNKKEFINKLVGVKYKNRGYDFDGCDCFGVIYLYLKHALNIEIDLTESYKKGLTFQTAFLDQLAAGQWEKLTRPTDNALVFMLFAGDIPMHCGIMLNTVDCLHAFGNGEKETGQVVIWKMSQIKAHLARYYSLNTAPRVEFYAWSDSNG